MNTEHSILLGDVDQNDLVSMSKLIERNEREFKEFVLSRFSADSDRYEYCDGSLTVDSIDADSFTFSAMVSYYAGCPDMNKTHEVDAAVGYEIIDGEILFSLPEFLWDVR
ncbi:hypothetical protein AB7360_17805 [Providencia alcalifaciens]|uniref:hypothetical protein n=1 Tax=Providencia alcalifaciens TaxID=126385 RepID=UPI0024AB5EBB|nr:hypothetical protein [Providencia rettgeri]ELR5238464.1 hypothetical protein [Providencia rettgeri]ELR5256600.1 hypothetical protein [Providencia rettgeri]